MVQRGELAASGLGFELQSWERKQRCTLQPPRLLTSSQRIGKPPLFFRWGGEDWDEGSEIVMSCMWVSELVVDFFPVPEGARHRAPASPVTTNSSCHFGWFATLDALVRWQLPEEQCERESIIVNAQIQT